MEGIKVGALLCGFCAMVELEGAVPNLDKIDKAQGYDMRIAVGTKYYKISSTSGESDGVEEAVKATMGKSYDANQNVVVGYLLPIGHLIASQTKADNLGKLLDDDTTIFPLETSMGWTLLHSAAMNGSKDCINKLLSDGRLDPNEQTRSGDTALMIALREKSIDAAKAILEYYAKVNESSTESDYTLDVTLRNKKGENARLLLEAWEPGDNKKNLISLVETLAGVN